MGILGTLLRPDAETVEAREARPLVKAKAFKEVASALSDLGVDLSGLNLTKKEVVTNADGTKTETVKADPDAVGACDSLIGIFVKVTS